MAKRVKALGCGKHVVPASRHACVTRSSSTYSRRISPIAVAKITAVPAMFPKIIWRPRQNGSATSTAAAGATVASSTIQNHRSSFRSIFPLDFVGDDRAVRHEHALDLD